MVAFNIIVLSWDEEVISYLDTDLVDIKETRTKDKIRSISLEMPIEDDDDSYRELFKQGNKIYVSESEVSSSCLYVINSQYKLNHYSDNTIEVEAEEVIVELNNVAPFVYYGDEIRVVPVSDVESTRQSQLREWFGKYYHIGKVDYPTSELLAKVSPVGSMTLMELMKYIESETGNKFITWYVPGKKNNKSMIYRFLDFLRPSHLGNTHKNVIELGYNSDNAEYEVDESDTFNAIFPIISYSEESTATKKVSTSTTSLTKADIGVILNEWKDLTIKKGDEIPKEVEKYSQKKEDGTEEEKTRYISYWKAPFAKQKGEMYIVDDQDTGIEYSKIISMADADTTTITPKIGSVKTSETDVHAIYNACAEELIAKRYPEISCSIDTYNMKDVLLENEEFCLWDKVYMKAPEFNSLLLGRVTETQKDPHNPGNDKIVVSNCTEFGRIAQAETFFEVSDMTVKEGEKATFEGTLYTKYETELGDVVVEPLKDKLVSLTVIMEDTQLSQTTTTTTNTTNGTAISSAGVSNIGNRPIFVNSDNIFNKTKDRQNMNDFANVLRSKGYSVTIGGIGPNYHYTDIPKMPQNALYVMFAGGLCSGTFVDLASRFYQNKLKPKNIKIVHACVSPPIKDNLDTLTWLRRADDDNFSPRSFTGLANPGKYLKDNGIDYIYGTNGTTLANALLGNPSPTKAQPTPSNKGLSGSSGEVPAQTTTTTVIAKGESVDSIMREAASIKYKSPSCSPSCDNVEEGYECVRKNRVADCFGMSAYLYKRLNDNGHKARIVVYYSPYAGSGTHRSVQVFENNTWKDPSYAGFNTLFKPMTTKKDMKVCKDAPAEVNQGTNTATANTTSTSTTTETVPGYKKTYNRTTDANGKFKLNINLMSEEYTLRCTFGGDTEYESTESSVKLVVTPSASTVISKTTVAAPASTVTGGGSVCKKLSELTGVAINSIDTLYKAFTKTKYLLYYNEQVNQQGAFNRIAKGQGLNCVDSNQVAFYALKELGVEVRICNGTVYCSRSWGHIWCEIRVNGVWSVFDASAAAKGRARGQYICGSRASKSQVNPAWLLSDDGR